MKFGIFPLKLVSLLALIALSFSAPYMVASAITEPPEAGVKLPALIKEESVSTFIPSDSAGDEGIAVNIILPERPRYKDGAPVCVVAPAGDGASSGISFTMHSAQAGFVEVRLAFPGGGVTGFTSGGIYDYRGAQSQAALKDVLLFASGKLADKNGKKISELAGMPVSQTNIGLVGWSNGGNVALATLDRYSKELQFVRSLSFYESPVGSLFFPPNLGSVDDVMLNPHYHQGSAATGIPIVDWNTIRFDPVNRRKQGLNKRKGEPDILGMLYFDENHNHIWDETSEFALHYVVDVGLDRQIYPPGVISFLEQKDYFGSYEASRPEKMAVEDKKKLEKEEAQLKRKGRYKKWPVKHVIRWPKTLADLRVVEAYYRERDGSQSIANVCKAYPNLLIMVVATQVDHMQRQPDHPHIAYLYNTLVVNKAAFVKLNPEPVYTAALSEMNRNNFKNNEVNASIDAASLPGALLPEGVTKDYVYMEAAVAELADRVQTTNVNSNLTEVLCVYKNSKAFVKPAAPAKDGKGK